MKIAILSSSLGAYSTRRLREACVRREHQTLVLSTLRFSLLVGAGGAGLFFRERALQSYDAVLIYSDGSRFKLSDYRGKVVMLDFWAHW